jgi:2-polyprenyl-3-methyl-5-hydroxy-6-metoxy-1,4-benzoquinol methylase
MMSRSSIRPAAALRQSRIMDWMPKLYYLTSSTVRHVSAVFSFRCPNCGSKEFVTVDRKYFVTSLRRCRVCQLMYRVPPDDERANFEFYQQSYRQGFTTELPGSDALRQLLATKFAGTEKCYRAYISILCKLGVLPGARIFDYGCSWGYGSWQLKDFGYRVSACEISETRAEFARAELGIDCSSDVSEAAFDGALRNASDCFFSAHVLEHVPSPARVIELARLALRPGGLFVAFTPNGSEAFRRADPHAWHLLWGRVHPNFIDDRFYCHHLARNELYLDSTPAKVDMLGRFGRGEQAQIPELSGSELLCVARL